MNWVLVVAVAAFLWVTGESARAEEVLYGRYFGVDDASGATIDISPDSEGYRGTFYDPQGASQAFEADRIEDSAEAVLDMDGRTVLLRMAPLPYGAQVSLVPFDQNGNLVLRDSRSLGFVREGIRLPEKPLNFMAAPRTPGKRIAGNAFLASYQFWDPTGVLNGYLGLPDRFRTLMRMFPAVQLDVIWKICLAPGADRGLAIALRGQGVACPEVIDGIADAQRANRFDSYKAQVESERSSLHMSVRCADGYVESKSDCDAAAKRLSTHAISMRTAAMVLREIR